MDLQTVLLSGNGGDCIEDGDCSGAGLNVKLCCCADRIMVNKREDSKALMVLYVLSK